VSVARYLGALSVLAVGVDHIVEYYADYYRAVPTIGTLFVLDFIGSLMVAAVLFAPVGRFAGRSAGLLLTVAGAAGLALGAGTLAGLLVSENVGLFGFMETGYRNAIVLSMAFDIAAALLMAAFLALRVNPHANPRRALITIQKEISR
jgi:hypothetical protein